MVRVDASSSFQTHPVPNPEANEPVILPLLMLTTESLETQDPSLPLTDDGFAAPPEVVNARENDTLTSKLARHRSRSRAFVPGQRGAPGRRRYSRRQHHTYGSCQEHGKEGSPPHNRTPRTRNVPPLRLDAHPATVALFWGDDTGVPNQTGRVTPQDFRVRSADVPPTSGRPSVARFRQRLIDCESACRWEMGTNTR